MPKKTDKSILDTKKDGIEVKTMKMGNHKILVKWEGPGLLVIDNSPKSGIILQGGYNTVDSDDLLTIFNACKEKIVDERIELKDFTLDFNQNNILIVNETKLLSGYSARQLELVLQKVYNPETIADLMDSENISSTLSSMVLARKQILEDLPSTYNKDYN